MKIIMLVSLFMLVVFSAQQAYPCGLSDYMSDPGRSGFSQTSDLSSNGHIHANTVAAGIFEEETNDCDDSAPSWTSRNPYVASPEKLNIVPQTTDKLQSQVQH